MARSIRMFSAQFPYEGGAGDVSEQDVEDADLVDKEEAYGALIQSSLPLERRQVNDIGQDVAAIMFGKMNDPSSDQPPAQRAAEEAYKEMWKIGRRLKAPYRITWEPTGASWGLASGGLEHATSFDRRMQTIARRLNVSLFRMAPKSGGVPIWVFTSSPRALPIVARGSGQQVTKLNGAV